MLEATRELSRRLLTGDRQALARSITLIESLNEQHREQAALLLDDVFVSKNKQLEKTARGATNSVPPIRLGIAGPPGAGKSTLIETLGSYLTKTQGMKVAVLTIDPSSHVTGGSILGDKARMDELSRNPHTYVRSSPNGGVLGGLARYTNDVITLCEGGGYDVVILETVGLGQSEVRVDDVVDVVALIIPPTGGDELQGVKKGIVEVADIVGVNKCDGDMMNQGKRTVSEYRQALHFCRPKQQGWTTPVLPISAATNDGVDKLWSKVFECHTLLLEKGELWERRRRQAEMAMWDELKAQIMSLVEKDPELRRLAAEQAQALVSNIVPKKSIDAMTFDDISVTDSALSSGGGGHKRFTLSDVYKESSKKLGNKRETGASVDQSKQTYTTPRAAASRLMKAIAGRLVTPPSNSTDLQK